MIGAVGTMLGSEGVNIANMSVSRNARGDAAVMILSVDTSVEPHVVDRLRRRTDALGPPRLARVVARHGGSGRLRSCVTAGEKRRDAVRRRRSGAMAASCPGMTPRCTSSPMRSITGPGSSRASAPTRRRRGTAVFRLTTHLERLRRSAALYEMDLGLSTDELPRPSTTPSPVNGMDSCYIRPIVFRGYGEMGLFAPATRSTSRSPSGRGAHTSARRRSRPAFAARSRATAATAPTRCRRRQRPAGSTSTPCWPSTRPSRCGYDEAILLNEQGFLADGSGENVFVVRDGVIHTPPTSDSCLPGITRDSVMQIATRAGLRGARGQPRAHRPLLRRRGVPLRHRRRDHAGRVGRRPGRSAAGGP